MCTDPRLSTVSRGRSINLAMSRRARAALALVGLEGELLRHGIPMRARMIHDLRGGTREIPYDARTHQVREGRAGVLRKLFHFCMPLLYIQKFPSLSYCN